MTDFCDYAATELTNISASGIVNFRLYNTFSEAPLKFFSTFPYFQIQFKESGHGQVTTPCVKSYIGLLGLNNDVAVMTECQCGERIMYMVTYQYDNGIANKLNSLPITRRDNLSCVTHFDLTNCLSFYSGHLEQLAIACSNIQGLNLQNCSHCLKTRFASY